MPGLHYWHCLAQQSLDIWVKFLQISGFHPNRASCVLTPALTLLTEVPLYLCSLCVNN